MLRIITGTELTKELYLKTWELDNKTFENKDKITKEEALDWFYRSGKSTIVLIDEDKLIGYITPYLVAHSFANHYILSDLNYKDALKKDVFVKPNNDIDGDIYIFSTVVKEEYRDKKIFEGKSAIKILTEAVVEWIYNIKKMGVSINYIFADMVSESGEKYLKSLKLKKCFVTSDDSKYAGLFNPSMFEKCDNVGKLYELYSDDSSCKKYDKSILNGHEYLSFKDNKLYFKNLKLLDLVEKYGAPLEIAYTPIITEQINKMKSLFNEKIKKYNYRSKYNYAYATKANYYSEVVLTALKSVDSLETSSAYDISIIIELVNLNYIKPGFTIICNGFKNETYIENIRKLLDKKINVIPVVENMEEFDLLNKLNNYNINVGIRYNSDFEARLIKNDFISGDEFDNRFGFNESEMFEVAEKINNTKNLTLKLFHFHFGGTITNIDNYIKGLSNIYELYCSLKRKYDSLEYFDFGGGFPVKYSLTYNFDYDYLVDSIIKTVKSISIKNEIPEPQLVGEHGRYTVADHSLYIYPIDVVKKNWYIINGSLMNMTPDMWGISQDFTILPINLLNNKCIPVSLGGETCDPDDRYFLNDKNVKLFMPKINDGEKLYIAIFSIGAYQEIISGIGGVHHCMIPEGDELIIYKNHDDKLCFYKANNRQTSQEMLTILDYNKDYLSRIDT